MSCKLVFVQASSSFIAALLLLLLLRRVLQDSFNFSYHVWCFVSPSSLFVVALCLTFNLYITCANLSSRAVDISKIKYLYWDHILNACYHTYCLRLKYSFFFVSSFLYSISHSCIYMCVTGLNIKLTLPFPFPLRAPLRTCVTFKTGFPVVTQCFRSRVSTRDESTLSTDPLSTEVKGHTKIQEEISLRPSVFR